MKEVFELVRKFSTEEDPILLLGETGVGKSHIAEMIYRNSGKKGDFVTVYTPGLNEQLLESELFGHCKGAFTGADRDKEGLVDAAKEGILFFDEIGEIPPNLQLKLMRLIEKKKFRRVGENGERKAEIRIIAATNRDIEREVKENRFREDLYFRLHVLTIHIPPLRDRREDIHQILNEYNALLRGKKLTQEAMDILMNYSWPGNVRELIHVMRCAGIRFSSSEIGEEIGLLMQTKQEKRKGSGSSEKVSSLWQEMLAGKSFWDVVKKPFLQRDLNREEVKAIIQMALDKGNGTFKESLRYLNIPVIEHKKFLDFLRDHRLNP